MGAVGRRQRSCKLRNDQFLRGKMNVSTRFAKRRRVLVLSGLAVASVAIAPFLAGSSGMALRRFAPYDVIGAGLWGSTFVLLGYVFWQSFSQVVDLAKKGALALGTDHRQRIADLRDDLGTGRDGAVHAHAGGDVTAEPTSRATDGDDVG